MNENNDKQHKSLRKVHGEHMAYKLIYSAILGMALHGSLFAQTCISYTSEGISGCMDNDAYAEDKEEVVEATPLPQVPQQQQQVMQPAPVQPMKTEMDLKVEEFYNTYDKPPREFAEWTVNPTVENALRWARKYDEMMTRNKKMAEAWGAAQKIYKQTKEQGGELPELSKPLPPIPEYPGLTPPPGSRPGSQKQAANPYSRTSDAISFAREKVSASGSLTPIEAYGGVNQSGAAQGPIEVSYYFSNVCPFCKKFEPELRLAMERLSSVDVQLTCVDTSPKEQKRENIEGIIDCDWRPLLPGELEAFGVRSTPTLLISTDPNKPLVKREGVLVATELEMLLKNLAKSRSKS